MFVSFEGIVVSGFWTELLKHYGPLQMAKLHAFTTARAIIT